MSFEPGPARALLFVADLTSRAEFLAAFGPFATARGILLVTHRSELPETGDRLVFRLALADGETMLAGEALVTGNRGVGRRGVVRLEPTRLDLGSRVTHAALLERARPARGGDLMGDAIEKLAECQVLEEAQATGEIDSGDRSAPPRPATEQGIVVAVDEDEPLPPTPRRGRARSALLAAACGAALLLIALVLRARVPERVSSAAPATPRVSDSDPDPGAASVSDRDPDPVSVSDPAPIPDPGAVHRAAPGHSAEAARVTLHLLSSPPGATFRVNGKELGPAPTSIRLPAGSTANIYATFDGLVWQRRVTLAADQPDMSVRAVLGQ